MRRKIRKSLDTSFNEIRGAKPGEARNPKGVGGWAKGQSGNPSGRPIGSRRKAKEIKLNNVWDSWKTSNALQWLFYALNYRLPQVLCPHEGELTAAEHIQIRQLLFKNFWEAAHFCRKIAGDKMLAEMGFHSTQTIDQMLKEGQARRSGKIVDIRRKGEAL